MRGLGYCFEKSAQEPKILYTQRSLFGEILDWMLAPLLFVWPVSIAVTHFFSTSVANFPYDQALRDQVTEISRKLKFVDGRPHITFPKSSRSLLRSDEIDSVYFDNAPGGRAVDRGGFRVASA